MKQSELLRLEADARDMVESSELAWTACVREYHRGESHKVYALCEGNKDYRLALAIVEGRPVFEGDVLYCSLGFPFVASKLCNGGTAIEFDKLTSTYYAESISKCSWQPPHHKTVMVELLVEDAEKFTRNFCGSYAGESNFYHRVGDVIRKALGEIK